MLKQLKVYEFVGSTTDVYVEWILVLCICYSARCEFTKEVKGILKDFYAKGMTGVATDKQKELITEASNHTRLEFGQIKVIIDKCSEAF